MLVGCVGCEVLNRCEQSGIWVTCVYGVLGVGELLLYSVFSIRCGGCSGWSGIGQTEWHFVGVSLVVYM